MVEPMPPSQDDGDAAEAPSLPPFLVPPGSSARPQSSWTTPPAPRVAVAPPSEVPATPPARPARLSPYSSYESPRYEPPRYEPLSAPVDPTTDLENWGPPLPPAAPPEQRSLLRALWPWGMRGIMESVEVLLL